MPSRNPSCEKCGATMYLKAFPNAVVGNNADFWVCCDVRCGHVERKIWAA